MEGGGAAITNICHIYSKKKKKSPELSGIRLNVFAGLIFQYTGLLYIRRHPALLLMLFKKV